MSNQTTLSSMKTIALITKTTIALITKNNNCVNYTYTNTIQMDVSNIIVLWRLVCACASAPRDRKRMFTTVRDGLTVATTVTSCVVCIKKTTHTLLDNATKR